MKIWNVWHCLGVLICFCDFHCTRLITCLSESAGFGGHLFSYLVYMVYLVIRVIISNSSSELLWDIIGLIFFFFKKEWIWWQSNIYFCKDICVIYSKGAHHKKKNCSDFTQIGANTFHALHELLAILKRTNLIINGKRKYNQCSKVSFNLSMHSKY